MSPETTQAELDYHAEEINRHIQLLVLGAQELEDKAARAEGRKPRTCCPVLKLGGIDIEKIED